jgi:hypothetical protein
MGISHQDLSEVSLILNLETGNITPQYHVVFDDSSVTVSSVKRENEPPHIWDQLCRENTTLIPTDAAEGAPLALHSGALQFYWMTPDERGFAERLRHVRMQFVRFYNRRMQRLLLWLLLQLRLLYKPLLLWLLLLRILYQPLLQHKLRLPTRLF